MSKKLGAVSRLRAGGKRRIRLVLAQGVSNHPSVRNKAAWRVCLVLYYIVGRRQSEKLAPGRGRLSGAWFFPLFVPVQPANRPPAGPGRKAHSKSNDTNSDYIVA